MTSAEPFTSSTRYPRLRPGPGLRREVVAAHQQARLQQAMMEIAAAHGFEGVTVRGLVKRARISTGTFYRYYSSTEDCLLCTYDEICGRAARRMTEAAHSESEPDRRLAAAIDRLFRDIAAAPQAVKFMLRGAPTVGPGFTSDLCNSAMQLGSPLQCCLGSTEGPPLDPLLLEGIVAGVARMGSTLSPTAGEGEIKRATAEAVAWIISVCVPLASDAGGGATAAQQPEDAPHEPRRLRQDHWGGVLGDERAMIIAATFRIARSGYNELSISRICREAGVSRRAFSRHFENLNECFLSALEERVAEETRAWTRDGDVPASRSGRVFQALGALCDAIDRDRDGARILFIDVTAVGTNGIDSHDRLVSIIAIALRRAAPEERAASRLAAEMSVAAASAVLRHRVQEQETASGALPILMQLILASRDRKHQLVKENQAYAEIAIP